MDPNVDWVSLSALLDAASSELNEGQLLHTSVFSLFEAMSAVEIGNPKMDAGARPKGDSTPLEQRLMQLELSPQQLLGVMDHLLCLEATWHNGGSLARTLYSSMYMMQPARTASNQVLSSYCRATEAVCAEVNHLVMTGCVCEEEDFNAHIAGLPLEYAVTAAGAAASGASSPTPIPGSSSSSKPGDAAAATDKLLAALSQAVDSQDLSMKQHKVQAGSDGAAAAAAAAAAVVSRLQFRRLLLQALIRIKRRQKQDLDQAAKLLLKAQAELSGIRASLSLGASHQGLGWQEDMNSHLVPAVPPRTVKVYTAEEAVDYFESLTVQLLRVAHITSVNSYRALKDYLMDFAAQPTCATSRSAMHIQVSYNAWVPQVSQQQQQPSQQQQQQDDTAAAAAADGSYDAKHHQHHIPTPSHPPGSAAAAAEPANGTPPPPAAAAAAAAAAPRGSSRSSSSSPVVPVWCLSPRMLRASLLLDPEADLGDDGELFMEQAVIAASNLVQALLMNRSRCRRRLRRGLEDWGNLYQHGLNADNSPQFQAYMVVHGWTWANEHPGDIAGPLATWVEVETCSVMLAHLLMGFELSLYEPADYAMVYWYVDLLGMVWQQGSKHLQEQQPALITTPGPTHKKGSSSSSSTAAGLGGAKLPSKASAKGSKAAAAAAAAAKAAQQQQQQPTKHSSSSSDAHLHSSGSSKPEWLLSNLILEAQRQLAMGTLRLMMALPLLELYKHPELPFNSEAQRFDQRFAAFHSLQRPEPLVYEQFVTSTSVEGVEPVQLLRLAGESFKRAQQACGVALKGPSSLPISQQQQLDLKAMDRVAATNGIAVMLLARTAASSSSSSNGTAAAGGMGAAAAKPAAAGPQLKPHYEFAVSKNFPTLTLKSAAAAATAAR
ncbi:hypothetical protein OEZ85_000294 [Tetradesmus obliquus]|uniref:Uncharacterized protein n=1 Tax=Tetradesmus obliquus TaxID=3088 RepID=A0ABY8UQR7_TETOB|nr:hypothetical protein OEZ85_000294 [Tetradesmus obliquus]